MQNDYACPFCQAHIPIEDINVATDIALCRACGRTTSFSLACEATDISKNCLNNPPRHIRLEEGFGNETSIVYRRISPLLLFFVPFTALWSGGSMFGIYGTQIRDGKFDLGESLFGIPFLFGTVILLGIIAFLAFGKWIISLDRGQGSVFVGVGPFGWTRYFTYNRNTIVSMRITTVRINEQPQKGILVRTDDVDFVFGALIKDDAKRFIAAVILQKLGN
jgi:hypothetical protein